MDYRVVILGSGNVATHVAHGLQHSCHVVQVYSRTLSHAQRLAADVPGAVAIDRLDDLMPDADIYIMCVPDDAIARVAGVVPDNGALWLHTSGSTSLEALRATKCRCGVLYPMQSFSRELEVNWSDVHIFVEAVGATSLHDVTAVARCLSSHVTECDSHRRRLLHVAAVFSCNFTNDLWACAAELLGENDLPFEAMLPLINNAVSKLSTLTPAQSQTGPASRADREVMASHMAMLTGRKREIYRLLSDDIMDRTKKND